jgi:hypothetical protein
MKLSERPILYRYGITRPRTGNGYARLCAKWRGECIKMHLSHSPWLVVVILLAWLAVSAVASGLCTALYGTVPPEEAE